MKCHINGGFDERTCGLCETKVDKGKILRCWIVEEVSWFHIAMDNPFGVLKIEGVGVRRLERKHGISTAGDMWEADSRVNGRLRHEAWRTSERGRHVSNDSIHQCKLRAIPHTITRILFGSQ